eukprot:TRINITY_DN74655_c0_g1_i1.p1 TRINITY_DN74655_c0_g1~~TRINITY_DN74655_c0_g1_i1.p1  ORF type:complete len:307 (+),score=94.73 TRINITY_DN74655_c0_g1_i1:120-1040(+)
MEPLDEGPPEESPETTCSRPAPQALKAYVGNVAYDVSTEEEGMKVWAARLEEQRVRQMAVNEKFQRYFEDYEAKEAFLAEKEESLRRLEGDLAARKQRLEQAEQALETAECDFEKRLEELSIREARIAQRESEVEALSTRELRVELREKELEAARAMAERTHQQERPEKQEVDLAAEKARLAALERCLTARERALGDAEQDIYQASRSTSSVGAADAGAGHGTGVIIKRRLTSRKQVSAGRTSSPGLMMTPERSLPSPRQGGRPETQSPSDVKFAGDAGAGKEVSSPLSFLPTPLRNLGLGWRREA